MLKKIFFIVSLSVAIASSAQLSQKFDSLFQSFYKSGLFEGTALIADSSGIIYHQSFGFANYDYQIPNDTVTIFRMGSLEKQFTAMLVLQLIEKGKLSMQGKISEYLPKYRKETGNIITIENLLTHTSGIPNYTALPNVWKDSLQLAYQPGYILQNFCSGDLEFKPGTKYKYSNTDYFILAQILQQVAGKPLKVLLKQNILIPAGMYYTGLEDNLNPLPHKALGYYRLGDTYFNEPYIYVPNTIGAASIYSTAFDMFLWDRALYSNKLLSVKSLKSYCSPHFTIDPDYSYGYGWEFTRTVISVNDTIETMEHSGAIRAFRAVIFRVPNEKKCIILLSNCANESGYELFDNIMQIFRGNIWKKPKQLLADTLYTIMLQSSVENAIEMYKTLKNTDSTSYDYSSSSLSFLGERLFLFQNYYEAAAIFNLAVQENPHFAYGYYYLGKTYEKWGKPEDAIRAYTKAVDMDKNSRPGIDAAYQLKYLNEHK
ncbi:MAG: serine hydrolase [Chitinophagaceae bacterium]